MATRHGTKKRVKTVSTNKPKRMTLARGDHIFDMPPIPNAMGIRPEIVVKEVRIIGRRRSLPELTMLRRH